MRALVFLVSFSAVTTACTSVGATGPSPQLPLGTLAFDSNAGRTLLRVEIADTPEERQPGLMGRTRLPEHRGMAFLEDGPTTGTFWMKDTLIPLSIAFWDESGRIVDILDMQPCHADPCRTYGPDVPYVGAVEVNEGWFRDHGVQAGDHVELRA